MPTVTLKISDDEKALWVESAQHAGVSLSEWIRQRCKAVRMTDANVTVWPNPLDSGVKVEQSTLGDPVPRHPGMIKTDFKQGKKK